MESTKEKLLALLEENRGQSLSGQELALRLGISGRRCGRPWMD